MSELTMASRQPHKYLNSMAGPSRAGYNDSSGGNFSQIPGANSCSSHMYYSAPPQSSYSSNRMRSAVSEAAQQPQQPATIAAEAATTTAMTTTTTTPSCVDVYANPLGIVPSFTTIRATVYYQQQQQQQQQQQTTSPADAQLAVENYEIAAKKKLLYAPEQLRKQSRFNARKKFQFAILVIRAVIRIRRLRYTAEPLHVEDAIRDPYRVKVLRKVIDGCAFRVYGHWVKKGEGQNRAALFENTPRTELHALYINNLSR